MTIPVYPNGDFSWSDRIDEEDIDYAEDINSVATEVVSIEQTLGLLPQVQKIPILGPNIQFANVDQRLDYITSLSQVPVCQLSSPTYQVPNLCGPETNYGQWNTYSSVDYDPFGMFNGADMTCQISGFYLINATQFWTWWSQGYHCHHFWIDNIWKCSHRWDWDFPQNGPGGYWRGGPSFEVQRSGMTQTWWMGLINQGQRLRILSENGTSNTPCVATNLEFKAALLRRTPAPTTTAPSPVTPATTNLAPTASIFAAPGHVSCGISSGVVTVEWPVVADPFLPETYAVAVYYAFWPNGLAYYAEIPAPGGETISQVIATLSAGSYTCHVWALGGILDPPHAITTFVLG